MWKKDEVKIKFTLTLKEVTQLDKESVSEGQLVWVSWKRGSKEENKGDSQKVKVKNGEIVFGTKESFSVDSTLFQDQRTKEFKGKNLELFIKEDFNKKTTKILGKAILDLGKFAHPGIYYSQTLPFFPVTLVRSKKAMLNPPSLRFDLEVTWTHFNKKLLVKKEQSEGTGKSKGEKEMQAATGNNVVVAVNKKEGGGKVASVEVGDEEFDLKTVDNELSDDETTTGWSDDDGEDEGDPFSSDDEDDGGKGKGKGKEKEKDKPNGSAPPKGSSTAAVPPSNKELEQKAKEEKERKEKEERERKEREEKERRDKEEKAKKEKEERERKEKEEKERKEREEKDRKQREKDVDSKIDKSFAAVAGKGEEGLKLFLSRMGKEVSDELYPRLTKGGVTSVELLSRRSLSELRAMGLLYGDCTYVLGCLKNWYPELFVDEPLPPKPAAPIKITKAPSGDYRSRLTAKKKKYKQLKEDFEGKRKDKKEMAKNWKEQTKKKRRLKKRFKAQKEELAASAKQKEEFERKMKELEQRANQAKQTEEKLRKEMEDKQKAANKEIAELKDRLNAKTEEAKKSSTAGKNTEQDAGVWRVKAQELEREGEKMKVRVKELETQVNQAKQVEEKLKKELDDAQKAAKDTSKDLQNQIASLKKSLAENAPTNRGSNERREEKEKEKTKVAGDADVSMLKEEAFNRKIIEKTIYCARLVYSSADSSEEVSTEEELIEEERKKDGALPVSGEMLFKFLKDRMPFDPTPPNGRLIRHMIKALRHCVKRSSKDSNVLAGWLSYITSLMHMLLEDKSMKRYLQNEVDDPRVYGIEVKAGRKKKYKDPGIEFIHALQDLALTTYISLLQNLHRQVSPLLVPAILDQPPFTILQGGGRNYSLVPKHCLKTTEDITVLLDEMLAILESNRVFSSVVKQFFIQTFYLINVTLFNHWMKGDIHSTDGLYENEIGEDSNLYSATNAFQVKIAVSQLVAWIYSHSGVLSYNATKSQFNALSEAANVLCMPKSVFISERILKEFPTLNPAQIQHLLDRFQPDSASTERVPMEFRELLEQLGPKLNAMPIEEDPFVLLPYDPAKDEEEPTTPSRRGH